jgi:hypothetical protein
VKEGIKGIRKQTRDGATKEGITEEQEQRRQQAWSLLKVIAFDWEKGGESPLSILLAAHLHAPGLSISPLSSFRPQRSLQH